MKITKEIKLENKIKWVIEYCKKDNANILNSNFVDKYVEKFNPKYRGVNFGAFKCPELGRLLSLMYHKNILDRGKLGMYDLPMGFPKWIYIYQLKQNS